MFDPTKSQSSETVRKEAERTHPNWTKEQLESYLVGYFDAMLDESMRRQRKNDE